MHYRKDVHSRGRSKNVFESPHRNINEMQTQEKVSPPRHNFASQKEKEKIIIKYKNTYSKPLSTKFGGEGIEFVFLKNLAFFETFWLF